MHCNDFFTLCASIEKSCLAPFKDLLSQLNNTFKSNVPLVTYVVSDYIMSSTAPCLSPLPQLQDIATIPQNSMSPKPSPQLLNVVPQTTTGNFENDLPEIDNSIDT
ncbi:hypothetical protein Pint_07462 [Pistacia integerrima]|uniref:Uncharacterized protein n=1 Tax=Pistacia integerrima TaxID=434235 RepID=A0ACC0XX82_9ROSI|nr:hypothetical protein Pint_07462 [Pistacia integerrima]